MTQNFTLQQAADGHIGRWLAWFRDLRCLEGLLKPDAVRGWKGKVPFGGAFWLLVVGMGLILGRPSAMAEEGVASESQMKAAFLVNFPKYVDWPSTAFAESNSPVIVAIFGDDQVVSEFRAMIEGGRTINGRPVVLKRITSEEEINTDCQILFISASERQRIPAILAKVEGANVLTVSDSGDFLENGGIINLTRKDRNIRLGVNLNATRQAHLRISSNLLSVADVVKGKSN